jgi:TRAP-type C4-dicarboxylate transport system substrate-binding protein
MHTLTRRSLLGTAASATATLGVCLPRWAHAAEFSYRYGGNLPESHPLSHRIAEAAAAIARETDGRVAIRVFPNSQLGGDTAMISDLQAGRLEFMTVSGLILSTVVPVASISGIGYAFANYGEVWAAMDGLVGAKIRDDIAASGFHPFDRMLDSGYRQVTSAGRPISEPADFHGMKFRVPAGPLWTSMFEAFGASPVAINFADANRTSAGKSACRDQCRQTVRGAGLLLDDQPHVGRLLVHRQPASLEQPAAVFAGHRLSPHQ